MSNELRDHVDQTMEREVRARWADERTLKATRYPLDRLLKQISESVTVALHTTSGAYLAMVAVDTAQASGRPIALVVPSADDARALYDALLAFAPPECQVVLIPDPDVSPYAGATPDRNVVMERLRAIRRASTLAAGDIVVASVVAWCRRAVPEPIMNGHIVRFDQDAEVDVARMRQTLVASGYTEVGLVEDRGTFSVRGDLIDVFGASAPWPLRVELYGDMIESMRRFDPKTQRSAELLTEYEALPVREELLSDASIQVAREQLARLGESLRVASSKVGAVIRDLQEGTRFFGIESLMPALYASLDPVHTRLPADTLLWVMERGACESALESYLNARREEYLREVESGDLMFEIESFFVDEASFAHDVQSRSPRVEIAAFADGTADETALAFPSLDNADIEKIRRAREGEDGGAKLIIEGIERWREHYGRVIVTCGSRGSVDKVARWFADQGVETHRLAPGDDVLEQRDPPWSTVELMEAHVRHGFRAPARGVALVTDRELLGRAGRRGGRELAREATVISSFRDLHVGDLIVHIDHGVGRYAGLERVETDGVGNDFLVIEYADGDRLYLPVYRLSSVSKYVGSAAFTRVDRLGGTTWTKTKERIKGQLADMAEELLHIYAERSARRGHAFEPPGPLYRAFEASFPFEETPHQADAIHDVLSDLQSERPMDRLLCGDVGFGKTEVAIRAAYLAVLGGKQVAVLVPTTVLAEQHLNSFRERLSQTAARVEALSRFRTTSEVREIMAATREGKVDILIGTHRLLSKDLEFADLGLLIVDEEQRFGVSHKERIKSLRATVDVLTMSATPIPRTLEMSMLGIRDLSVILTPPAGRLSVRTHIARSKDHVIREGILAEIKRGGQVFFVHNRVETIHNLADKVRSLVPEATVIVAHAQMKDTELEDVMIRFLRRDAHVLVTTTIIESGIDIASANTIFVNRADRFGMAQLHQLRGRVGRGSDRAYCYLLVPDPNRLTPTAKRRLEVLQEHTDLGAGMQIAQHDLDLRGAGNILGRDQSGHIEAMGFELFSELLQEAIDDVRGEGSEERFEPEVNLPVAAYIPEAYIEDIGQRLAFYKRYSMATTNDALEEVHGEIQDRYGRAPEPVVALREIVWLKLKLRYMMAPRLEGGPKSIVVELRDDTPLAPERVMALIRDAGGDYTFRPPMTILRTLRGAESEQVLAMAMRVVRELSLCDPHRHPGT